MTTFQFDWWRKTSAASPCIKTIMDATQFYITSKMLSFINRFAKEMCDSRNPRISSRNILIQNY